MSGDARDGEAVDLFVGDLKVRQRTVKSSGEATKTGTTDDAEFRVSQGLGELCADRGGGCGRFEVELVDIAGGGGSYVGHCRA